VQSRSAIDFLRCFFAAEKSKVSRVFESIFNALSARAIEFVVLGCFRVECRQQHIKAAEFPFLSLTHCVRYSNFCSLPSMSVGRCLPACFSLAVPFSGSKIIFLISFFFLLFSFYPTPRAHQKAASERAVNLLGE
jgi:hypothetical protein